MDYNSLSVPADYPNPANPLHVFLSQKDPNWHTRQAVILTMSSSGGVLTAGDGQTEIQVPAGTISDTATLTFAPQPFPDHSIGNLMFANRSFHLTAVDASGNPLTLFNPPLEVTIRYSDEDIGFVDEGSLRLYFWEESSAAWQDAVTTCGANAQYQRNLTENWFSLQVCHLSEFAVMTPPQMKIFLPFLRK